MALYTNVRKEQLGILLEYGFHLAEAKKYEIVRYQGPCSLILFESGKLLVQGQDDAVRAAQQILKDRAIGSLVPKIAFKKYTGIYLGSDECMKGDTFGGIVVAGVRANDHERAQLIQIGVADSKKLHDTEIVNLAEQIPKIASATVLALTPRQYNAQLGKGNVTPLLNELHEAVREKLDSGARATHVVDQFPGCRVGDRSETKAEDSYVEVAAASILARARALQQFSDLSKTLGFPVPRGSTHVKDALLELQKRKLALEDFVKMHFKNVKELL